MSIKDLLEIRELYKQSRSRIFFLDYDSALVPFANKSLEPIINYEEKEVISVLARDHNNRIVITSGREKDFLECVFIKMNVTLVAEQGLFIKEPCSDWIRLENQVLENPLNKNKISTALLLENKYDFLISAYVQNDDFLSDGLMTINVGNGTTNSSYILHKQIKILDLLNLLIL